MNLIERFELHYVDSRENTLINYKSDIKHYFKYASERKFISECDDIAIVEATNWEIASQYRAEMVKNGLSPRTINRKLSALRTFFDMCIYLDDVNIKQNPFKDVRSVKAKRSVSTQKEFLDDEEIGKLLTAIETEEKGTRNFEYNSKRDLLLYSLIITTGLRISEALNLTFGDINEDELLLYVRDGKGGKDRIIPIDDYIIELLKDYMTVRNSVNTDYYNLIFLSKNGNILDTRASNVNLKKYCERAGIKVVSNHELRHTFATRAIASGMNLVDLQELMGHESLKTTGLYTHANFNGSIKVVSIKR